MKTPQQRLDNKGQQRTTKDNKGQQRTTKDNKGQQRTTKDDCPLGLATDQTNEGDKSALVY